MSVGSHYSVCNSVYLCVSIASQVYIVYLEFVTIVVSNVVSNHALSFIRQQHSYLVS